MPDIADILVTQYGLKQTPTAAQVEKWASVAEKLMNAGVARDKAGQDAAKEAFPELF